MNKSTLREQLRILLKIMTIYIFTQVLICKFLKFATVLRNMNQTFVQTDLVASEL